MKISERLIAELKNKEYRDAFVSEHIDTGIPFQVRALREQRGLTQKELAERAGMKQERISAIENPNYKNAFTLSTLKRLASAFDIALIVRFAPISQLVDWELKLSPESLQAVSFNEDPYFREEEAANKSAILLLATRTFIFSIASPEDSQRDPLRLHHLGCYKLPPRSPPKLIYLIWENADKKLLE